MKRINITIVIVFLITSSSIIAKDNKKKLKLVKEKKIVETIKEVDNTKQDEEVRDADDDDKSENTETVHQDKPYYKVVSKKGTILRDKPNLKGRKLFVIPEEIIGEVLEETTERVTIDTRTGNWLKVEYNGKLGWIFSGDTIVKEDKEDFLPLTLIGYFLIKSKEPIFYRKPGREILGILPEYPVKGDIVPVYRKKNYLDNEYYYFELKSLKPNSEEIIVSWIGAKGGSFLSPEAFSAYTLKSRKKKPKGIEKEIIGEMIKRQTNELEAFNYRNIDIKPFSIKEGKSKKQKAYIVGFSTGTKTANDFGNLATTYYLLWKNEDTFYTLLAGDKKKLKVEDLDDDGIPEVFAQFETKGEPPLCHIYVYKKGMFEQLFPNYIFCDTLKISDGNIEIQKDKEKLIYKYSKGEIVKVEPNLKSANTPDKE